MKIRYFLFCILISTSALAQPYLGTWTSYLPYNKGSQVVVAGDKIYCSTNGGLFFYNKSDNSLNKFSKENGLSDSDISALGYSELNSCLLIAYKNSNIDLIKGNQIINIPDVMRKQILGDKNINSVYFYNNLAYLSCGFGVVVLDTEKYEIKETYTIVEGSSIKVNSTTISDSVIYAATDEGLYYAELKNSNLLSYENWSEDPRFASGINMIKTITSNNSIIYASVSFQDQSSDSILYNKNGNWETYPFFQSSKIPFIKALENGLLVCSYFDVDVFDSSGTNTRHVYIGRPLMAEMDNEGGIWIADFASGLVEFEQGVGKQTIIPEGPSDISVFEMNYSQGRLLCVAGGATSSWNNLFKHATIYSYNNNKWYNWTEDSIRDLVNIIIDPIDTEHYFAASWGHGLLEFQGDELINQFNENNSPLQNIIPGGKYVRLAGVDFDAEGNLWITNSGVGSPLSVLDRNGNWTSFEIGSQVNEPNVGEIIVTEFDHKWITLQGGRGLFVFNENEIEKDDDDESVKLSIIDKNNDIITNEVYSIAEDRDGNIWVGTNVGPLVYYSPYRVFDDDNFYAQQIIIPRNDGSGLGDPLLGTESVTCIEVDGANRKWLGTKNGGLFLVSEDGLEQIHEFNTSNSPLLSNNIIDIEIADKTGEVFIATEKGIISFIGDATTPDDIFEDVYVFPNPVREDFFGEIVVAGLVEDTYVKITDLNGNLVFETKSLGGQAIWDGKNYVGDRVATGVYLVFCSTSDGLQTFVTKLLFIH